MYDTPCVLYIYIYPFIEYPIECLIGYFLNSLIENLTDKGLNMEHQGTLAEAQDLRISG